VATQDGPPRQFWGPYYRKFSPTQTGNVMIDVVRSGEIWGKPPRGGLGDEPRVKAYRGHIPTGEQGFEFWSFQKPNDPYGSRVYWSNAGEFLVAADNVVKLKIAITKVTQPLR
jgi:hypothetical protein